MRVPAGAVDEAEVVRDLDKPHAPLDEPSREQEPLAEFAAVALPKGIQFAVEREDVHEVGPCHREGLPGRRVVVGHNLRQAAVVAIALPHAVEQLLAALLPAVGDLRLPGEPGRADTRVGEIDVASL